MDITVLFMLVAVLAIAIFDVWVIYKKGKYHSISANIIRGSKQYPLVVLMAGVLLGHLFWSMDTFDVLSREELVERCKPYSK